MRRRNASGERVGHDRNGDRGSTGRRDCAMRRAVARARGDRIRARVGDRHRKNGIARAGASRACIHPCAYRPRGCRDRRTRPGALWRKRKSLQCGSTIRNEGHRRRADRRRLARRTGVCGNLPSCAAGGVGKRNGNSHIDPAHPRGRLHLRPRAAAAWQGSRRGRRLRQRRVGQRVRRFRFGQLPQPGDGGYWRSSFS